MVNKEKKCRGTMEIFQRTVGYYASRMTVNKGKLEEIKMRTSMNLDPFRETQQEEKPVSSEESACP